MFWCRCARMLAPIGSRMRIDFLVTREFGGRSRYRCDEHNLVHLLLVWPEIAVNDQSGAFQTFMDAKEPIR